MNAQTRNVSDLPELRDLANLQAQLQRPALNINIDGSFELGWGIAILCAGSGVYYNAALPKPVWGSLWTVWIGYLPLICMVFAPYAIPRMIKRFITWPRTGYVAHPNDVKLGQLLRHMGFGLALGFSLALPFVLVSEIRALSAHAGPHGIRNVIVHGIELLVCATLAVYLGRKIIRKRQPLPAAYDAAQIDQALGQTAIGRKSLRISKVTVVLMFVGLPLLLGAVVFGLMCLGKSMAGHPAVAGDLATASGDMSGAAAASGGMHWPQLGAMGFLVATNALLYLMANAVAIKRYRWKWLALVIMLVGPILTAFTVPYSSPKPELTPMLDLFPPPVMLCIGLVWFMSGAATLVSFIRRNPLPAAETP